MSDEIVVGVSGGKDSTAAILILRDMGFKPIGVFLTLGKPMPEHLPELMKRLKTPLLIQNVDFESLVIKPSLKMWRRGMTPNPCAICNSRAKFAGLKAAADKLGIKKLATGHYATMDREIGMLVESPEGDQSYFLALVPNEILKISTFPLSGWTKEDVVKLLSEHEITIPESPSQDLCFAQNLRAFLEANIGVRPGPIILKETGQVVGTHRGSHFYTIGERVGAVAGKRIYVHKIEDNTLVASFNPTPKRREILLIEPVIHGDIYQAKFLRTRYRGPLFPVHSVRLTPKGVYINTDAVAPPGQLGVLYSDDMHILAGGIIGG